MDEPARPRPIGVMRKEGILSPNRPTLDDVLNGTAPAPYTLAAYTAFLSQQHCLETLEFVTESRKYGSRYSEAVAAIPKLELLTTETDDGFELVQMWTRLLDVYVKPGAPREINLPAEERDDLVEYPYEPNPAPPAALEPSVKRMYDLMSDSIFIPFCNSLKVPSHAQTYSAISELSSRTDFDPSRMTFDDRSGMSRRTQPVRKGSPPIGSTSFAPRGSPPQTRANHSSSLSSAINRSSAGNNRLSTHVSHSSAASEAALTDGSDPDEGVVMTPPTTPPTSELGGHGQHHRQAAPTTHPQFKPQRSESGAWKKTMKFFGGRSDSSGGKKGRD